MRAGESPAAHFQSVEDVGKPCGGVRLTACGNIRLHIGPQIDDRRRAHGRRTPKSGPLGAAATYSTSSLDRSTFAMLTRAPDAGSETNGKTDGMPSTRTLVALLSLLSLILPPSPIFAQDIVVGERTIVAAAPTGWALVEPHLVLDPTRPSRLLGISIVTPFAGSFEEKGDRQFCRAVLSDDAGRTWQPHDFPPTWCYDPWLAFTPTGEAVLALSGRHPAIDSIGREGGLLVFHSPDGGQRWSDQAFVLRRSPDHPTITVDTTHSKWRGSVYVMSGQSIQVARSTDGGRTFAPPVRVTPNNLINLAETPVVLSDGSLVLSFVDGGWWGDTPNRAGFFRQRRAWVVRSTDGAENFSAPFFITDACGQPPHFQQSFLAVDASAGFRDRLYFACRRAAGGPIVVVHSSDAGARWSDPVPVSTEPDDSTVARVATMTANPKGVLGVAWMVGRSAVPCHEVWFTASVDGGQTFLAPQRISAPSCAVAAWSTSGDYFGLTSSPTGRFHLLWGEPANASGILSHVTIDVRVAPK